MYGASSVKFFFSEEVLEAFAVGRAEAVYSVEGQKSKGRQDKTRQVDKGPINPALCGCLRAYSVHTMYIRTYIVHK